MVKFNEEEYTKKKENFVREYKRITPYKSSRPLTENLQLRTEYKECIVRTYNDIVSYSYSSVSELSSQEKSDIQNRLVGLLSKLKECFNILKLNYEFDEYIRAIDIDKVTEVTDTEPSDGNSSGGSATDSDSDSTKTTIDNSENNLTMPQTAAEFVRIAHQTINVRYDGDPTALDCFIDALELLKDLCEPANTGTFVKFVKTRLEGKAREAIGDADSIDTIINRLRATIKHDSSKVIEGRFLALRADKSSLFKFSERAEDLAEQLYRSLCNEGFGQEKAKEITIQKTIEMCRKSTRNDTVKAVLAATAFSEPKEVISKMIVEINNIKQDRPQSSYTHKYNNQNKNHGNGNGNNNRGQSNGQNHFHGNRNRPQNNSNNNNRYNNNGNSNGRSFNRGGQNNYGNYNRGNSNQSQQGNQTIRHISGNETTPGDSGLNLNHQ